MRSRVNSTWHIDYAHCTAGLDLKHCPGPLSHSKACSSDPDRGRVEQSGLMIRILDPYWIWIQGSMWRAPMFILREWQHEPLLLSEHDDLAWPANVML